MSKVAGYGIAAAVVVVAAGIAYAVMRHNSNVADASKPDGTFPDQGSGGLSDDVRNPTQHVKIGQQLLGGRTFQTEKDAAKQAAKLGTQPHVIAFKMDNPNAADSDAGPDWMRTSHPDGGYAVYAVTPNALDAVMAGDHLFVNETGEWGWGVDVQSGPKVYPGVGADYVDMPDRAGDSGEVPNLKPWTVS
jgi:hypothetical protein